MGLVNGGATTGPIITFYSITGQRLLDQEVMGVGDGTLGPIGGSINVYFGSKLLQSRGVTVMTDRLGSVRANSSGERFSYYPYGYERNPLTTDSREKFGTYFRDNPGQDYADQRYYNNWLGRFNTADPSRGINPADPGSWNKYAYVGGDPINYADPSGLCKALPGTSACFDAGTVGTDPSHDLPDFWSFYPGPVHGSDKGDLPSHAGIIQDEWDSLSTGCQNGLKAAIGGGVAGMVAAVNRAWNGMDNLQAATAGKSIDWTLLAGIGLEETRFRNTLQQCPVGLIWGDPKCSGVGIFQIDLNQNPSVSSTDAFNLSFAAKWAANRLASNMSVLAANFPNLTAAQLLQATAASYNLGVGGISGNLATIDDGTRNNSYGATFLNLMDCFK